MALKRKTKISESFSMASMTDMIFLLLIFFMITSTVVVPNAIKVTLPQAQQQSVTRPLSRITVDASLNYYVAYGTQQEIQVSFDDIVPFLQEQQTEESDMSVLLYADETVPYREIVKILNIANEYNFRVALATRVPR